VAATAAAAAYSLLPQQYAHHWWHSWHDVVCTSLLFGNHGEDVGTNAQQYAHQHNVDAEVAPPSHLQAAAQAAKQHQQLLALLGCTSPSMCCCSAR
jgi:hypothetical protein